MLSRVGFAERALFPATSSGQQQVTRLRLLLQHCLFRRHHSTASMTVCLTGNGFSAAPLPRALPGRGPLWSTAPISVPAHTHGEASQHRAGAMASPLQQHPQLPRACRVLKCSASVGRSPVHVTGLFGLNGARSWKVWSLSPTWPSWSAPSNLQG